MITTKTASEVKEGDVLAGMFGAPSKTVTKVVHQTDGSVSFETQPGRGKPNLRADQTVRVES